MGSYSWAPSDGRACCAHQQLNRYPAHASGETLNYMREFLGFYLGDCTTKLDLYLVAATPLAAAGLTILSGKDGARTGWTCKEKILEEAILPLRCLRGSDHKLNFRQLGGGPVSTFSYYARLRVAQVQSQRLTSVDFLQL